jgi:enolase-phosphatase E1
MAPNTLQAILLDIEGTTTPISFVHDVLFPYARLHFKTYLEHHADSPDVVADLARLREEHAIDVGAGQQLPPLIEQYVYWLIDRDRKSPALKSLQGKIWEQGYNDGTLTSPIFADVPRALQRWRESGIGVNIFSSGSVLAQKLLFAHTDAGDLTKLINAYFDTTVGKKTEAESYRQIASSLSTEAAEIHFISDVIAELDAASDAGMKTSLCVRPGNAVQISSSRHKTIQSFEEIRAQ